MSKWYVIRNMKTGAHMPALAGQRAGYTHEEFSLTAPPRLFTTSRGAANALTLWLRGRYRVKTRVIDTFDGPDIEIEDETIPVPERGVRESYSVVPVQVINVKEAARGKKA